MTADVLAFTIAFVLAIFVVGFARSAK